MYRFEERWRHRGFRIIAGTDEAGRGPLAGPVVAACVVLPDFRRHPIQGIRDSKMISEKKREKLFDEITRFSKVGVGIVSEAVIDEINIFQATRQAMKIAFGNLSRLIQPEVLLIDGNIKLELDCKTQSIIKGDQKSGSVAAASIIAKVTRDRLMREYHAKYPQYEFDRHKGYPTLAHRKLIALYGLSPIHRKTFKPCQTAEKSLASKEKI